MVTAAHKLFLQFKSVVSMRNMPDLILGLKRGQVEYEITFNLQDKHEMFIYHEAIHVKSKGYLQFRHTVNGLLRMQFRLEEMIEEGVDEIIVIYPQSSKLKEITFKSS